MTNCKPISYEKRRERLEKNRASDPRYAGCVLEQLADVPLRVYLHGEADKVRAVLAAVPDCFLFTQDTPMKAVCHALVQHDVDKGALREAVLALMGPVAAARKKVRNG